MGGCDKGMYRGLQLRTESDYQDQKERERASSQLHFPHRLNTVSASCLGSTQSTNYATGMTTTQTPATTPGPLRLASLGGLHRSPGPCPGPPWPSSQLTCRLRLLIRTQTVLWVKWIGELSSIRVLPNPIVRPRPLSIMILRACGRSRVSKTPNAYLARGNPCLCSTWWRSTHTHRWNATTDHSNLAGDTVTGTGVVLREM